MRNEAALSFNCDMTQISEGCRQWGMRLNSSKTKAQLISRPHTNFPPHPPLPVDGALLNESEALTKLRVTSDLHLTFERHLIKVPPNAAQKLGIVCKESYTVNSDKINATC